MSTQRASTLDSGGWFLVFLMIILFTISTAVLYTWIQVDTQDIAYGIHRIQNETEAAKIHISKLEIERDSLLSPQVLVKTAERLGMNRADRGQIRRIDFKQK